MIEPGVIEVWRVRTDVDDAGLARMESLLDESERARAARFRFDKDRRHSIVARATLRTALAQHLGEDPRALRFVFNREGKPALENGALQFNVSHSGGRVLVAIARDSAVGIDVESEARSSDLVALARRYFAEREAREVLGGAVTELAQRFFATWTAKESVIKAAGGGLSHSLQSFEVEPAAGRFTPVRNLGDDPRLDGWFVAPLDAGAEGFHAALAVRGSEWQITLRGEGGGQ